MVIGNKRKNLHQEGLDPKYGSLWSKLVSYSPVNTIPTLNPEDLTLPMEKRQM